MTPERIAEWRRMDPVGVTDFDELLDEIERLRGLVTEAHCPWVSADNGHSTWPSRSDLDEKWRATSWGASCRCGWQGRFNRRSADQARVDHGTHVADVLRGAP